MLKTFYISPSESLLRNHMCNQHNTLHVAREDRTNVFRAVRSRKHIHGIFYTKGRREHIDCIHIKERCPLTSNTDCAHNLIDKLEFANQYAFVTNA